MITNLQTTLDECVERFEDAWDSEDTPSVDDFFPPRNSNEFAEVAIELLRIDMERRWARSDLKLLREYRSEFSWLVERPDLLGQLAFEEYRLRSLRGELARVEAYATEFNIDTSAWPPSLRAERDTNALQRWNESTLNFLSREGERLVSSVDNYPLVGDTLGDFTVLDVLGEGKFSRVYLARQGELAERRIVLKVSPKIWHESDKLAKLQHTHIVPVYSIHRFGALQGLCMPYLGRRTVYDLISLSGPRAGNVRAPVAALEQRQACELAAKVADGLQHAHQRGIVHRDLKPANILISDEDEPLILDFNLSDELIVGGAASLLVGGTLPYMAPEHLESVITNEPFDQRADVYSLGVILFQLVVGTLPFPMRDGNFVESIMQMIADRKRLHMSPRFRSISSQDLSSIVLKCLAPNPADRYQSAADLREDLRRHLADRPLQHAHNHSLRETSLKWLRRHRHLASLTSLAAVAFITVAICAVSWLWQARRTQTLEAQRQADIFQEEFPNVAMSLAVPLVPRDVREQAVARAEAAANRFAVLTSATWQKQPPFSLLDETTRFSVQRQVGELMQLAAETTWDFDAQSGDSPRARYQAAARECLSLGGHSPDADPRASADPVVQRLAAVRSMRQGTYADALPILEQVARAQPDHPLCWLLLGNCEAAEGKLSEADESFTRCIALAVDAPMGYFQRGVCRLLQQRYAAAERDFSVVLQLQPELASALLNRAVARKGLQQLDGALTDLSGVIAMGTFLSRAYLLRGSIYEALGEDGKAATDTEHGLLATPEYEEGWLARGYARMDADPQGALADFEEALRLNPRSAAALKNIAHVYAEVLGQPQKAIEVLRELQARDPREPFAAAGIAVLDARLGNLADAVKNVELALSLRRDAQTCYQAASAFAVLSKASPEHAGSAIELLRECLHKDPSWFDTVIADQDYLALRENPEFSRLLAAVSILRKQ